ncbi:MAG: PIN domain-containing protein [Deltaproteobacteria bacterium]|nr:PIN domain-containing protein [Deltaproteobacteria bacterium]
MILVDSCVWIDWLRDRQTSAVSYLQELRRSHRAEVCISGIIYFEVLRGIASDTERCRVRRFLDLLERRDYLATGFEQLVEHAVAAEHRGLHLKKLGDWLILKTVLDHTLTLLTSDRDFHRLRKLIPIPVEPVR